MASPRRKPAKLPPSLRERPRPLDGQWREDVRWIVGRMYQFILPLALLYDEPEPAARARGLLIESARAALSDAPMEDFTGNDDDYGGAAEFLRAAFMQCGFDYRDPVIAESLMLEIQRTLDEKAPTP